MCVCVRALLGVSDVRQGAVEGDAVRDEDVEAVLPVGLVHPVAVRQRERLPLLAVTCSTLWIYILYIILYTLYTVYMSCTLHKALHHHATLITDNMSHHNESP